MECEFEGIPQPTVEWTRDGVRLVESGNLEIVTSQNMRISRVVINSATSADAGLYTCTGINAAGSVSGMIQVDVNECE